MIGVFELDPYNPPMKFFHYLGAGAGTGTVFGYFIQQVSLSELHGYARLVAPIILGVICFTCFILWRVFNRQTDKYQKNIRKECEEKRPSKERIAEIRRAITILSLKNVIAEGIFLFMGATALSLWLCDYNKNCEIGCAGPLSGD